MTITKRERDKEEDTRSERKNISKRYSVTAVIILVDVGMDKHKMMNRAFFFVLFALMLTNELVVAKQISTKDDKRHTYTNYNKYHSNIIV